MPANLLGIDNINQYAQIALERLNGERPLFAGFTTDYSTLLDGTGVNAVIPIFNGTYTLNDTDTNGVVAQDASSSIVTLTLGTKDVTADFSETKWRGMSESTIANSLIPDMVQEAAGLVAVNVFNSLTYAAVGSGSVIAAAAFSASTVNHMSQLLSTAKAPIGGRSLIVLPTYYETFANSQALTNTTVAQDVATNYRISRGFGFEQIVEWANLPTNSQNLAGVAMQKSGMTFAMREPTVFPGDIAGNASDQKTGLAFQVRNWRDMGKIYLGVFIQYGFKIGNSAAIIPIRPA